MTSSVFAIGILVISLIFLAMGINIYNGLVSLRNQLERAWSNIDVILKQRHDEIPQIIQVIEQYANYEAGLIEKVATARTRYGQANTIPEKIQASQDLSLALKGIFAIGEAYPELKANQNFIQLQSRISQLENTISDRREAYNETVANFNTRIDQFPDVFVARFLSYQRQALFQATEEQRQAPNLKMKLPDFTKAS